MTGVSPLSLGETTAVSIASAAPSLLILASRTPPKLSAVVHQIASTYPSVPTKSVIIDLSSQASIRSAAASIQKLTPKIDVLINNAGVMMPERHFTADGIEMLFGTNYVGSFLLTNLLMPQLRASAKQSSRPGSTRVVNLTSAGHRISPIRFSDYNFDRMPDELPEDEKPAAGLPKSFFRDGEAYTGFLAYGQSKTGNVLFSMTLTERLGAEGILSFSVHPGCKSQPLVSSIFVLHFFGQKVGGGQVLILIVSTAIVTDLSRHLDAELTNVIESTGGYWKTHDEGATTTLVAAFDPALTSKSLDSTAFIGADALLFRRIRSLSCRLPDR